MRVFRQGAKWCVKAVGGLAANLALLTVWVDGAGIHPAVAVVPNFVILAAADYLVARHWIFPGGVTPSGLREHARQLVGMQAAMLGGKAANYMIYLVLLPIVDYRLAWVVGAVATVLLTFGANRWWWTRTPPESHRNVDEQQL